MKPKILILDYSVERFETPVIKACLPNHDVTGLFIDTEESFPDDLNEKDFTHVIHTGSTLSITEASPFTKKASNYINASVKKGTWQMGICYGHQLMALALVGNDAVRSSPKGFEAGWGAVDFNKKAQNLFGLKKTERVWQHHFDEITEMPKDSEILATNSHSKIQAYVNYNQRLLGTQFHPEFDKTRGDRYFIKDKKLLETHGYDLEEVLKYGPSFNSAKVFFDFFLKQ